MSAPPHAVYVIDDDPFVCEALGRLIRSAGSAVETFADAESFLAEGAADPSCLIVDVGPPGISGLQLLETPLGSAATYEVIVITANPDERLRHKALSLGAYGFFARPPKDDTS